MFAVAKPQPPTATSYASPRVAASGMGRCPFPPEADAAKIDDAAVVVEVEVAANGRASGVRVVSDPGHGFASAAVSCAMEAKYEPARDTAGTAVSAKTKVRIHFER
jgi:TonB family protein